MGADFDYRGKHPTFRSPGRSQQEILHRGHRRTDRSESTQRETEHRAQD